MRRIIRFVKALWKYILYGDRVSFNQYVDRMKVCSECLMFRNDNWTCGKCGCYIDKKAKMTTESCPENKWG